MSKRDANVIGLDIQAHGVPSELLDDFEDAIREEIESRLAPRPETGGDAGVLSAEDFALEAAHIIATWDSTDWEGNLIALIKSRDAALLASQGQGEAQDIANLRALCQSVMDGKVHSTLAGEAAMRSFDRILGAHPQPAPGLREALEKAVTWMREYAREFDPLPVDGGQTLRMLESDIAKARAALAQSEREGKW